jgi:hypothetical protein
MSTEPNEDFGKTLACIYADTLRIRRVDVISVRLRLVAGRNHQRGVQLCRPSGVLTFWGLTRYTKDIASSEALIQPLVARGLGNRSVATFKLEGRSYPPVLWLEDEEYAELFGTVGSLRESLNLLVDLIETVRATIGRSLSKASEVEAVVETTFYDWMERLHSSVLYSGSLYTPLDSQRITGSLSALIGPG